MASTNSRPQRLTDRQLAARRRRFVGRESELTLFREALQAEEPPFAVLHIHGPGGVGKTTLLRECVRLAEAAGVPVLQLDARNVEASPAGFEAALRALLGGDAAASPIDALPDDAASVLILDTYEQLAPLDAWLRERFLPQLPARAIVVIAGRRAPSADWRTDPDWRDLIRIVSLRNLSPEESRAYLTLRGVPDDQHSAVLACTHGHPLALSLAADVAAQSGEATFTLQRSPDVVTTLVEKFVQHVPGARHRLALQACAHARVMTEALLREALAEDDAHDVFDWLRGLSFMEQGPLGVFPHDLARDVLDNEARWRDFETYRQLHFRLRNHYLAQMARTEGLEQLRHMTDVTYLHRNNPLLKPYFDWKELGTFFVEPALRADTEAIADIIARFEGDEAGRMAVHWMTHQPEQWRLVRDYRGECLGAAAHLHLTESLREAIQRDPGTAAAWAYAHRHAPPRPGEVITIFRYGVDAHTHHALSPVINALQLFCGSEWISVPHKAWSFVAMPDPDAWLPMLSYYNFHRAEGADFVVGRTRYGMFAHDWRAMPVDQWLDRLFVQQIKNEMSLNEVLAPRPAPLIVLSQQEFEDSVKQALKDYVRPSALASNPLMRSRVVSESADKTPAGLQALLREAVGQLKAGPKDVKLYRAVWHTYIEPAPTQEAAAELLGLPFNTYRYQLANGIQRAADWLWQRELHGDA